MRTVSLLTLGLLLVLVDEMRCNEAYPSFYGVKLCGREFIRAVIFTCGGSRWRKSVEESGKTTLMWVHLVWSACDIKKRSTLPLGAFLGEETFYPWNTNDIPHPASEKGPANNHAWNDQTLVATELLRPARSPISEEVLEALRSVDRKGRDVVVGLSNACCKWGCSKSEISSLCWTFSLK